MPTSLVNVRDNSEVFQLGYKRNASRPNLQNPPGEAAQQRILRPFAASGLDPINDRHD